jgi:hypothetical protein
MGRSSVEATKACLIRAVRAALAALPGRLDVLLPLAPGLAGFLAGAALAAAELLWCAGESGEGDELPELWPPTGATATAISKASVPASMRFDGGAEVGELMNLMPSLYADLAQPAQQGTNAVTVRRAKHHIGAYSLLGDRKPSVGEWPV